MKGSEGLMGPKTEENSGRVPLPSEELKRSGALCFQQVQTALLRSQDAVETVVRRLKRQLNKHCIRLVNIPRTKTRKGETAETRVKRTKLGDKTELTEREELERMQPKTITSEDHLAVLRSYILDLARAGVQGRQDKPGSAETDASQIGRAHV